MIDYNAIADNRGMAKKRTGEQEGNQALALLIARAMEDSGLLGKRIAELCGVRPQAVSNWKSTGRIDKQNLEKLARLTGKPLNYFSTLPPEERPYRAASSGRNAQVAESRAPYEVPAAAAREARKPAAKASAQASALAMRIVKLSPEQRRLLEQLVDQLARGAV